MTKHTVFGLYPVITLNDLINRLSKWLPHLNLFPLICVFQDTKYVFAKLDSTIYANRSHLLQLKFRNLWI